MKKVVIMLVLVIFSVSLISCGTAKKEGSKSLKLKQWFYDNLTEEECKLIEDTFSQQIELYKNLKIDDEVKTVEYDSEKMLAIIDKAKQKKLEPFDNLSVITDITFFNTNIALYYYNNPDGDETAFNKLKHNLKSSIDKTKKKYFS